MPRPSSVVRSIPSSDAGLLALCLLVGAATGLGAVGFRLLIEGLTWMFTGTSDYAATPGAAHGWLPGVGRWFVVLTPVLAGLLYGPLVYLGAPEARGHGVPEVMYAVARRGGRIPPRVAVVKSLASALCIGGGGSVGREGPIVQIGSALGSTVGRLVRVAEDRQRLLVACGAVGGIAATFNARWPAWCSPWRSSCATSRPGRSAWSSSRRSPPASSAGPSSVTGRSWTCPTSGSSTWSATRCSRCSVFWPA